MQRRTRNLIIGACAVGVVCTVTSSGCRRPDARALQRRADRARSKLRGIAKRIEYEAAGGMPDPDVDDPVLADRIRSTIGPLEKQLDLPRIHVMVVDHVALLHGQVGTEAEAHALEEAVGNVVGVDGVESFLHVGLGPGDTRPSVGRVESQQPSQAYAIFVEIATRVGGGTAPVTLVRAVLSNFLAQVPDDERRHVLSHLPDDVRALAEPPRRRGAARRHLRHAEELFDAIDAADLDLPRDRVEDATIGVLAGLVRLVPEEVVDIEATLPRELREVWQRARDVPDEAARLAQSFLNLLARL